MVPEWRGCLARNIAHLFIAGLIFEKTTFDTWLVHSLASQLGRIAVCVEMVILAMGLSSVPSHASVVCKMTDALN